MRIIFLTLAVIFNSGVVLSQTINITISNLEPSVASISNFKGEKTFHLDSIYTTEKSNIIISANKYNLHTGFYQIAFSNNTRIIFIYDGKDVILKKDANSIGDTLTIIHSQSNRVYYQFIQLNKAYKTKSELLLHILNNYPKDDDYYTTTLNKLSQVQSTYLEFINSTLQADKNSFIARYIRSARLPVINGSMSQQEQLEYLKNHSLDHVDFNDIELIYSDLYSNKSIEYLSYYRNEQFSKSYLEEEFMKAVDILLNKAKINQLVYQHIIEYLIDGFRKYGFDRVIDYLIENYVIQDNLCLDATHSGSLDRRIEQARQFKIRDTVPNIVLSDTSGIAINLKNINSDRILVLFYTSECTHCQSLIPQIIDLYNNQKEMTTEVLAISLDTEKIEWLGFIKDYNLNWINVSDLKGWEGGSALDYFIYATPTMILIDKNRRILAKPLSLDDLINWF
jgi:peroxiredoxin